MKIILTFILSIMASVHSFGQPEDLRILNEILIEDSYWPLNSENGADAYSWLSEDGLRLYFTRDNSIDEIWKANRKSINEPFSNPESVSIVGLAGDSEVFSSWLTPDENSIYFITRQDNMSYSTSLYKAQYDKINNKFINPIKINLNIVDENIETRIFISGPSLTFDLSQLFVYYSEPGEGGDRIACFTSNDGINYAFKNFLNNAENYCPGTLTNDGLSFYLTLREQNNTLVKLSRTDLNSDFSNPIFYKIDTLVHSGKNYYQPHVNTKLGIISMTYGTGSWETNDLEIIKIPTVISTEPILASNVDTDESWNEYLEFIKLEDSAFAVYVDEDSVKAVEEYCCALEEKSMPVLALGDSMSIEISELQTLQKVSNPNKRIIFEAMPNPVSDVFHLIYNFEDVTKEKLVFELMDLRGNIVKSEVLTQNSGNLEIDINSIAEGIYFYRIKSLNFVSENRRLFIKR